MFFISENVFSYYILESCFEKDGNDSLSIEREEEIQIIFHKFMDLLISSILSNNSINNVCIKCENKVHYCYTNIPSQ